MDKNAADLIAVLNDIESDKEKAYEKYGINQSGDKCNFIIKGEGKVVKVYTESQTGILDITIENYDAKILVGPVIPGSSIRDSIDFIKFGDFKNQVEFGEVSKAFNNMVYENLTKDLDFETLNNKNISFVGAFTYTGEGAIFITPIKLEILKEKIQ